MVALTKLNKQILKNVIFEYLHSTHIQYVRPGDNQAGNDDPPNPQLSKIVAAKCVADKEVPDYKTRRGHCLPSMIFMRIDDDVNQYLVLVCSKLKI